MKTKLFTAAIIAMLLFAVSINAAEPIKKANNKVTNEQIEASLMQGLNSSNTGLRVSCAYMLGEIDPSEKSIIELMRILREDNDENVRIMAALTLIKLEDARGLNLIKYECKYNDNDRTRKMCKHFYCAYLNKKYSIIEQTRDTLYALAQK
ncbi:MAG TPA: HEAT repeat domain-containing protein [Melioribacteraceae bacterium]|nr:HEAT repeat domain-containing protein [Melioribacteraceae bacterium]